MLYRLLIKPVFFLFNAEKAHHLAMSALKMVHKLPGGRALLRSYFCSSDPNLERTIGGIKFPNPVGLAAGFDKNARYFDELSSLGFGFIEIGTATPKPQDGNPKPRLFRLPADEALINRMGFNNDGVEVIASRLKNNRHKVIIGGNIGKNKITPNENAVSDYEYCFRSLYPVVDYFVINISSPNTPGLRELQEKEPLKLLLKTVMKLNSETGKPRPVFLKIAPDITFELADEIISIVIDAGLTGMIVSNTTVSRDNLASSQQEIEKAGAGGLSGKPLKITSDNLLKYIVNKVDKKINIIASGGVITVQDAIDKLRAGADLVQVYTGFIYTGPGLIKAINRAVLKDR